MKKIYYIERHSMGEFREWHEIKSVWYATSFKQGSLTYFLNSSGYVVKVIGDDDLLGHNLNEARCSKYGKLHDVSVFDMWCAMKCNNAA